jgi:hypothetical protein
MMKQLTIATALVLAVACKTEAPSPAAPAPGGEVPGGKARSAKIDIKPTLPASPDDPPRGDTDDPARGNPGARAEWRKRRMAKLDTNGDGVISDEERAAAARERIAGMHARLDSDGDGKLTPAELASAPGRMHFDDPAAVDTNHDGDISADELAAALKARRDQRRGDRAGSDGGGADQDTP